MTPEERQSLEREIPSQLDDFLEERNAFTEACQKDTSEWGPNGSLVELALWTQRNDIIRHRLAAVDGQTSAELRSERVSASSNCTRETQEARFLVRGELLEAVSHRVRPIDNYWRRPDHGQPNMLPGLRGYRARPLHSIHTEDTTGPGIWHRKTANCSNNS